MKDPLIRFGVSLPQTLIQRFDQLIKQKQYPNRSEAIRDLIRKMLIEEEIVQDQEVIGVLHLLYDHHKHELSDRLTDIQHDHHDLIISSTHVHLDHDNCLEVILMKGRAGQIRTIADKLIAIKGVKNGQLYLTSQGSNLK
ncbi:MAG: nickel-responsive transcriptional regulator NikR [Caldisericaceae bacterium]|nr:nickel-responsive transcriptional regulator NikR [Caldisericaceae bacterium]